MNPLEKREEVACAALRSPMSVEAQKVSVRKGETSSPLPSLIPSLAAPHLPIPHVSLAMPKTWQERERARESECECRFSFSPSSIPVHPTDCSIFLPLGVQTDREESEEKERERETDE